MRIINILNFNVSFFLRCVLLALILCLSNIIYVQGQEDDDGYRVFLISNLDDVGEDSKRLEAFTTHLEQSKTPLSIVVNGDFSLNGKMTHVKYLINWISKKPSCRLVLVQGDRDWSDSGPKGWDNIQSVEYVIENMKQPNVIWINEKGCPGPNIITLDKHLQLVGVNTQWFNHPFDRPEAESGSCKIGEEDEFYEELEDMMDEHDDQNVLVVGHFPIRSNGPYGGRYPLSKWIFPVPIISGFFTSYKQNVGSPKEINNERFEDFSDELSDMMLSRNTLIYASGHDRHTEILRHGNNYLLNTGAFGKTTNVKNSRFTVTFTRELSFTELHYRLDGEVRSTIYTIDKNNNITTGDDRTLFQAPCEFPVPEIPVNDRLVPCGMELPVLDQMVLSHPDSLVEIANIGYMASNSRRKYLGEHYRGAWTSPVNVRVLDLDNKHGGLIPYSKGGGRQTKSLKFNSKDGQQYTFRSVDKDPTPSLEYDLRNTVIDILLQDQITTQHPYGALAIPTWIEELDILHASPELFVMPDDAKLGPWRAEFGGMLGMLEIDPGDDVKPIYAGADDIKRSVKMMRQLYKDRDNKIEKDEFLKARVFDIVIGDWGRHEDNWKWAGYEKKKGLTFRPIPRDRDHVFSKWDGVLPWLADREWAKASGEHFDTDIKDMRSLTWQNRHFDRFLLSEADYDDWQEAAKEVEKVFTKEKIAEGLSQMPDQDDNGNKAEIKTKLEARATKIPEFAERYYELLAKEVDVVGSNKHELFEVKRLNDGHVNVKMFKLKKREKDIKFYERTFDPKYTKEIRLQGMNGLDIFDISGDVDKSILLRVIPGSGRDTIMDKSSVKGWSKKTRLYIDKYDDDIVLGSNEIKYHKHATRSAYGYDRKYFHYNTYRPLIYLFYNSDRGLDLGGQVVFNRYKYGKEKQSSRHQFNARVSTNGNLALKYTPRWMSVLGRWDVLGKLEYQTNRNFNFYFGKGLTEMYNEELFDADYYTLEYSLIQAGIGFSREFWKNAEVKALFVGYYNTDQKNANSIAQDLPNIRGVESRFNTQVEFTADLDLRDRNDLPRDGYRFYIDSKIGTDVKSEAGSYLSSSAHIEMFNTFYPFTLGLRAGGSINEGDVPFFFTEYLGRNTYLRGFRQNRFFGDKHLFFNSDFRWQIFDRDDTFIPMQFGVKLFADVGQLYFDNDRDPSDWFVGYGGGIYLVPYKERLTINLVVGFSEEETGLILFRLGKPF